MWEQESSGGNPFHRCVLAHYLADIQHDPDLELEWDLKALEIADSTGEDDPSAGAVRRFYPSLHLNLADAFRRRGDFKRAEYHLALGSESSGALEMDHYGHTVRSGLMRVATQIEERHQGPAVVFDLD